MDKQTAIKIISCLNELSNEIGIKPENLADLIDLVVEAAKIYNETDLSFRPSILPNIISQIKMIDTAREASQEFLDCFSRSLKKPISDRVIIELPDKNATPKKDCFKFGKSEPVSKDVFDCKKYAEYLNLIHGTWKITSED